VNRNDPTGLDAVANSDGTYHFILRGHLTVSDFYGAHITNSNPRFSEQWATGGQFLAGTVVRGAVHDAPATRTWVQGDAVGRSTTPGTLIARGWDENGHYPNHNDNTNHVGIFRGLTKDGKIKIVDQYHGPNGKTPGT
jgi:hypothetical protein